MESEGIRLRNQTRFALRFRYARLQVPLVTTSADANKVTPFYMLTTLRGQDIDSLVTLRGFENYRCRATDTCSCRQSILFPCTTRSRSCSFTTPATWQHARRSFLRPPASARWLRDKYSGHALDSRPGVFGRWPRQRPGLPRGPRHHPQARLPGASGRRLNLAEVAGGIGHPTTESFSVSLGFLRRI